MSSETEGRTVKTSQLLREILPLESTLSASTHPRGIGLVQQTAKVSPLRESEERVLNSSTSEASSQTDSTEGEGRRVEKSPADPLLIPSDSSYFTTSESKAKFLRQYYVQDMDKETVTECQDLRKQKVGKRNY